MKLCQTMVQFDYIIHLNLYQAFNTCDAHTQTNRMLMITNSFPRFNTMTLSACSLFSVADREFSLSCAATQASRGSRLNPDPGAIRALIRPDPTLPALLCTRLTSAPGSMAYIHLLCGPRTQNHLWPTSKDRAQGKHLSPRLSKYNHLAYSGTIVKTVECFSD